MALHYRKKPIVIEAMQLTFRNRDKIIEFGEGNVTLTWRDGYLEGAFVSTLEGGVFYPCKPDVFEKTYELADGLF